MNPILHTSRLLAVIADIDAANSDDPRQDFDNGRPIAREQLYAERMSLRLEANYPQASELLRIAARAQHIRRWNIPRDSYPLGREGYNNWRASCRHHHATLTSKIMLRHGYDTGEIAHVAGIIHKKQLKTDPDSQALENVVGIVFIEHYLDAFIAAHPDYDAAKLSGILAKTLRKMKGEGHASLLALPIRAEVRSLITSALTPLRLN